MLFAGAHGTFVPHFDSFARILRRFEFIRAGMPTPIAAFAFGFAFLMTFARPEGIVFDHSKFGIDKDRRRMIPALKSTLA